MDSATRADDRLMVMTFYIVVDVSYSMQRSGAINEANTMLPTIMDAVTVSPVLGDLVRVGMMDFSDDARVVLRLSDLRDVHTIPVFEPRGQTSYASAFRLLRQEIERDRAQLKADNYRMYRPAVFFITDGEPTDDSEPLREAFAALTEPTFVARPNIVPFGVGDATKEMVDAWVFPRVGDSKRPMRSFVARGGIDPGTALRQIAEVLVASIVASASSVSSLGESGGFVPPDEDDLDDWI